MDVNRLLLILVSSANFLLGLLVYWRNRKNPINISFSILTTFISLWTFSIYMLLTVWGDAKYTLLWGRIAFATGTFMAGSFAIFSIFFRYEKFSARKALYLFY